MPRGLRRELDGLYHQVGLVFGLSVGTVMGSHGFRTTLVIFCVVGAVYAVGSGLNEGIASLLLGYKLSAVLPFALLNGLTIGLNGGLSAGLIYWLTTAALVLEEVGAREVGTLKNLAQSCMRL